ncbi:hypothetical protein [Streptomyces sp. NPDC056987]|uniref:hypothetical protein n=1 Tax=Streptomyces sp. NPDC056987 TaxID=3345988 RepID=UPI003641D75A
MTRAAAAYQQTRVEAEQHGVPGKRATAQAQRAFVLAFTDPARADDELELAQQLLTGLGERATTLTTEIAALIRDAGTNQQCGGARPPAPHPHPCRRPRLRGSDSRPRPVLPPRRPEQPRRTGHHHRPLRERTHSAYYTEITHFMGGLLLPVPLTGPLARQRTRNRNRWQALVITRRKYVRAAR